MNILIVGKAPLERWGLTKIISEKIENVEVVSLENSQTVALQADVVVLCLSQIDSDHENLSRLQDTLKRYARSRILILESVSEKQPFKNLSAYLSKGISGYVTSMDLPEVFEKCLNKLLSGNKYICPDGLEWLLGLAVQTKIETVTLTRNELNIAEQLLVGRSVTQIARESNRKASTISTIKKTILRKTNAKNIIMLGEVLKSGQSDVLVKSRKPTAVNMERS